MMCFRCGSEAVAICRYRGRAVCKEHIKEGSVISHGVGWAAIGATKEWLEIKGAVWRGTCKIKGHGRRTETDKFFNEIDRPIDLDKHKTR